MCCDAAVPSPSSFTNCHDGAGYSVCRSHICISLYITDILWIGLISLSDPVQDGFYLDLPRIFLSLTLHNTAIRWINLYFSYNIKYRFSVDRSCVCLTVYSIDILCTCPVFVSQCTVRIFCYLSCVCLTVYSIDILCTCPVFVSQCIVRIFCYLSCVCLTVYSVDILLPVLCLSHSIQYRYSVTCPVFVSQCTV